mmetsp:Transcript_102581/g.311490  ORF Transcript_102581/g.311490 Transcript_102581/m.311490 type:complete len:175 (-) Transcript_102581:47-571(-)
MPGAMEQPVQYLFGIPVHHGPGTPYATRMQHWMHAILMAQLVMCCLRFGVLFDILGGFWMLLMIGLGYHAWHQNMSITYVCAWGLACLVNGVFDVLAIILPLIFDAFRFKALTMTIRICLPLSELFGAAFAWHLYHDFAVNWHMPVSDYDPLSKLVNEVDPEDYQTMVKGDEKK